MREKQLLLLFLLFVCSLIVISCESAPPETRAGEWQHSSDVGNFSITIDPTGSYISRISYRVTCGQQTPGGSYKVNRAPSSEINDDEIDFTISLAGQLPIVHWDAEFSGDGKTLSGTWKILDGLCETEFEIKR